MREYGSEFSLFEEDKNNYFQLLFQKFSDYELLRCGRDAIGFIIDNLDMANKSVLLPAFCCEAMIEPFQVRNWKVNFFSLEDDLSISIDKMNASILSSNPSVILLMNYFGYADVAKVSQYIKETFPTLIVLEDITHVLFSIEKYQNTYSDYLISSLRKWMAIPCGALALATYAKFKNKTEYIENLFTNLRIQALNQKTIYFSNGSLDVKEVYRDLFAHAEKTLDGGKTVYKIDPISNKILFNTNCKELKSKRRENYFNLLNGLKVVEEIKFLENSEEEELDCPFSLPILVENRDRFQKELAREGVYAPVLWPLNRDAINTCNRSKHVSECILSLPIDQRYGYEDMMEITAVVKKCIKDLRVKS